MSEYRKFVFWSLSLGIFLNSIGTYFAPLAMYLQAGLVTNDNHKYFLSHLKKLSDDGQKKSDTSHWTKLTVLSKEYLLFSGVTLRDARLALTINPNSKLGGFISVLINPPLNVNLLTRLSCVIVYLLSRAHMCAVFWGASFGGDPQNVCVYGER